MRTGPSCQMKSAQWGEMIKTSDRVVGVITVSVIVEKVKYR